jgi:hypothetical protein
VRSGDGRRCLVPIAPLWWVGVSAYADRAATAGRAAVAVLVALQVGIDAYLWQAPKAMWNDGDGVTRFAWIRWLPSWTDGRVLPFVLALGIAVTFAWAASRWARSPAADARPVLQPE